MTDRGPRRHGSGVVDCNTGKAPGVALPFSVALASGNPIGLAVTTGLQMEGQSSGRTTIQGAAKRTADEIAAQLRGGRFSNRGGLRLGGGLRPFHHLARITPVTGRGREIEYLIVGGRLMKATFGTIAAMVVAAQLAGCAGQPEMMSMQGTSGAAQSVTFPNGTVFGGASAKEASSLAKIAVDANNNNMKEFAAIEAAQSQERQAAQQAARQAEQERAAIKALDSSELKTSQKAVSMLEQLSAQQGTGQITLFFPTGSTRIPQGSLQYDRLVNFLDYLSRQSRGRTVLFVTIGSASATGSYEINERLSRERAEAPVPIIDQYLINVPHQFHKITGIGDMYAPKDASLSVEQRYQNVRIVAVYETDQVPLLPGDTKR